MDDLFGAVIFLLLFGVAFYFSYGCLIVHVPMYDKEITELKDKFNAIGCNYPIEANSAKEVACKELVFEINKKVNERNNLICVKRSL